MNYDMHHPKLLFFIAAFGLIVSGGYLFQSAQNTIAEIDELSLIIGAAGSSRSTTTCSGAITLSLSLNTTDATTAGQVSQLQRFLTNQILYASAISGQFGPVTEESVKKFQTKYNLPGSGSTNSKTRNKINSILCTISELANQKLSGGTNSIQAPTATTTTATTTTQTTTTPPTTSTTIITPTWSDALAHLTNPGIGWTDFTFPSNSKVVYVSQTDGNDTCAGTTPDPTRRATLLTALKKL